MEEEKEFYFKTQNLSVGYNRKPILENISLGVYKGQILTLIGPNGSGKSTILKNLIREMNPLGGVVVLEGKDINNYSSKDFAKQMSVVLTEKVKTELLTCRDVVAMGRYLYTNYFGKLTVNITPVTMEINAIGISWLYADLSNATSGCMTI